MSEKVAENLLKYDTILFDLDGVITSEEMYWKASALTVYEFLNSKKYYGAKTISPADCQENADEIKETIFSNDKTIKLIKSKGLNNNWDLAYIVIAAAISLETDDFDAVYEYLSSLDMDGNELCQHAAELLAEDLCMPKDHVKRGGAFYADVQHSFQEWILGSKMFEKYWHTQATEPCKTGLMYLEKPIVDGDKLLNLIKTLSKTHTLGIGTGRPKVEAFSALESFGILEYFDKSRIVHHDYITSLEQRKKEDGKDVNFKKPHPFMFLKGAFGDEVSDDDLLLGNYDKKRCEKTLVVGDALCDLLSAKGGGFDFLAVLTGIDGKDAKKLLKDNGAAYITDDVLCLIES